MSKSFRPDSLAALLDLINDKDLLPFAGGTDLMVRFAGCNGPEFRKDVVFLSHLEELKGIKKVGHDLVIGSATLVSDIAESADVPFLLREAARELAAPAVRNRATIGGNICNASPAGDSLPPLYVLGASLRLISKDGERVIKIEDFITGPGRTVLKKEELLKEIVIPLKSWNKTKYRKVGTRAANALTKCSISAAAEVKGGMIDDLSIAFGAVGPVIIRDRELEKKIIGLKTGELKSKMESIVKDYSTVIVPIDDQRSTAEYRKQVCLNLLKEFLEEDL